VRKASAAKADAADGRQQRLEIKKSETMTNQSAAVIAEMCCSRGQTETPIRGVKFASRRARRKSAPVTRDLATFPVRKEGNRMRVQLPKLLARAVFG
jgi:hypothetical protein